MKKILRRIKWLNVLMLTLAGIINAVGITLFLYPVNLYDSGISGTSMLLAQITPADFSLSLFLLLLNIPLFLYGLKKQGWSFTLSAVYTVAIYSLVSFLIIEVLPIDVSFVSPLAKDDLLLCAVFGGIISGIGSGTAIRYGGAMDGVEVMAVIFAKQLGLSVGTFVMIYNALLYILCGVIMQDWILPLYSIVTYYAGLKTIDFINEGIDRNKAATIITTQPEQVCQALSDEFAKGMTKIEATGGYSGEQKTMIYFVVNRFQIGKMRCLVQAADPGAYITITEVADVFKKSTGKELKK